MFSAQMRSEAHRESSSSGKSDSESIQLCQKKCPVKECVELVDCRYKSSKLQCGYKTRNKGTTCFRGRCDSNGSCIKECPYNLKGYFEFNQAGGLPYPDRPGVFAVGYTDVLLTDASRTNTGSIRTNATTQTARLISCKIWYPATTDPTTQPLVVHQVVSELYNGNFGSEFTYLPSEGARNTTNGARWLRQSSGPDGTRRLLVLAHAAGSIAAGFITIAEHLATHGFVIAAPYHTGYDQAAGGVGPAGPGTTSLLVRYQDISFVATEIFSRTDAISSLVNDTAGYGVLGWQNGGTAALAVCGGLVLADGTTLPADPRVTACFSMDSPGLQAAPYANVSAIVAPTFLLGSNLNAQHSIALAALKQRALARYYVALPGANTNHLLHDDCLNRQRTFFMYQVGRRYSALTPGFNVESLFAHCSCDSGRQYLRNVSESLWVTAAVEPFELVRRVTDSIPLTSIPAETYLNLVLGYTAAFFLRHHSNNVGGDWGIYLSSAYANATFPSHLVRAFVNTSAELPGNPLDIAANSSIVFEPDPVSGYRVTYHSAWNDGFIRASNGTFGWLYSTTGWDLSYPSMRAPSRLLFRFGALLPPPANRTQGQRVTYLYVRPNGRIQAGVREEDNTWRAPAPETEDGSIQRAGFFTWMPLHADWFDSGIPGSGIYIYNDLDRFVVTWDRVKSRADNGATINSFQFILFSTGVVHYRYGDALTRTVTSPQQTFHLGSIGVTDGRGYDTEGGKHHAVDFTTLNKTTFSVGSIYEIFSAAQNEFIQFNSFSQESSI
jgi:hypothetical protein